MESTFSARLRELLPLRSLVLFRLSAEGGGRLEPGYSFGSDRESLDGRLLDPRGRFARWLLVNQPRAFLQISRDILEHVDDEERELVETLGAQFCVPLVLQGQLVGVLLLRLEDPRRLPKADEEEVLELLAQQGALALENTKLYELQKVRLKRLHRAERLAAMGQLAAGAAHEIRNPLTVIRSTMQYVQGSLDESAPEGLVRELVEEVDRIDEILQGLLQLAREGTFQPVTVDPLQVADQTLSLVETQAERQGVRVRREFASHTRKIQADPSQLRQLFLNLLLNALQAMPDGGELTFQVIPAERSFDRVGDEWVLISISDTGPGIPPEAIEKIFDPFYTTKQGGTGLGLSISHRIVERHQGELRVESRPGQGTNLITRLPVHPWQES